MQSNQSDQNTQIVKVKKDKHSKSSHSDSQNQITHQTNDSSVINNIINNDKKTRSKTTSSIGTPPRTSPNSNIMDIMAAQAAQTPILDKVSKPKKTSTNTADNITNNTGGNGNLDNQSKGSSKNITQNIQQNTQQNTQSVQSTQNTQSIQSVQNTQNTQSVQGVRFVYLMHRKGAKYGDKGIIMKLGSSNNVPQEREKFEEGNDNDLKCSLVIECTDMDAKKIESSIAETLIPYKQNERGWYCISKDVLDNITSKYINNKNYIETTEKRGKLTQKEMKEYGFK